MTLKLTELQQPGYERLVLAEDADARLRALICIHSTALGPAAGGCRMWAYGSDAEAIRDVTRLARGMTYKNAMADLGLGGGKSVIIGDARRDKTPAMMRAFGRAVQALEGRYYTAEDVGISPEDMAYAAEETRFAVGLAGGDHGSGDPSPWTAEGVFRCLKVGAAHVWGSDDLTGRRVLVQGLGHVGLSLAEKLHDAGASLIVTDINQAALEDARTRLGAQVIAPDQVFAQQMDIFAPCALGAVLNAETVPQLTARLVCGAANNQLATPDMAQALQARGIAYLPDYVVNAGGIISVASEIHRRGEAYRRGRLDGIAGRVAEMLRRADAEGQTTTGIADAMVERMLSEAKAA
ncbi:Glu/Leu/Phe/Val dehydrogenase [Paracoccus sp. M683]|uniref:Glu/Leu/Phe/Val family dehydrogenase n=1 Tax=Paracoccus sp. M683 TaxID=2594268 RepID=UPI00117F2950|nr:Glu/Leu/Phe/Val dehydrogenase dimerization domain-containing protein [Paracoccus sp. M683]TRW96655.1 Glu/Leu/Phe/Val dehydrogenase [Paracoccus sp. M683]